MTLDMAESLSTLLSFSSDLASETMTSSFLSLLVCTVSILFGGVVAVFGTGFIFMAAVFGLAAFPQMQTFDKTVILISLGGMVTLEGALLWISGKGAMKYCPAIMGSTTGQPETTE